MKYLIINADDFGMSQVFNEVILDLIKKDQINSTTVMINRFTPQQQNQFDELIGLSKIKNLSIGLHLEFDNNSYDKEINSQVKKFQQIFSTNPSHLDIHKAYNLKDSFTFVAKFCKANNLPLRNMGVYFKNIKSTPTEAFHGSVKNFAEIETWLATLQDEKYYEILFHPGKFDPDCKSSLNKDREQDAKHIIQLDSLLESNNIKLVSYLNL